MSRAERERADALERRLERVEQIVDHIDRSIERIEVATIVREPSSALSVDAYNGLRRQIIAAAGERSAHLHQLAEFAEAVPVASRADLLRLVEQWLAQAGLTRVNDPTDAALFDVLGGEGDALRVLRPAYVDTVSGRPVMMGQAERVVGDSTDTKEPPPSPAAEAETDVQPSLDAPMETPT